MINEDICLARKLCDNKSKHIHCERDNISTAKSYCFWVSTNKMGILGEPINPVDDYDHGYYHSIVGRSTLMAQNRPTCLFTRLESLA